VYGAAQYVTLDGINSMGGIQDQDGALVHGEIGGGAAHIIFRNCQCPRVEVLGDVAAVQITGVTGTSIGGQVTVRDTSGGTVRDVVISQVTAVLPASDFSIDLFTSLGGEVRDIHVANCSLGEFGKIRIAAAGGAGEIHDIKISNSTCRALQLQNSGTAARVSDITVVGMTTTIINSAENSILISGVSGETIERVHIDSSMLLGDRGVFCTTAGLILQDVMISNCMFRSPTQGVFRCANGTMRRIAVVGCHGVDMTTLFVQAASGVMDNCYHSHNLFSTLGAVSAGTVTNVTAGQADVVWT
jgi:hypothetical protein